MNTDTTDRIQATVEPRLRRNFPRRFQHSLSCHPLRWLTGALLIGLLALSLPGAYATYLQLRWPIADPPSRSSHTFQALAYEWGSGVDGVMTPARFREHLAALRQAGYHLIGLEDVRNLVREGTPLPRNAVLITVDGHCVAGRWSPWREAVVHAHGRAVLFVNPESRHRPSWMALRQIVATPHWEVGAAYSCQLPSDEPPPAPPLEATPIELSQPRRYQRLNAIQQAALRRHQRFRAGMRRPFPAPVMTLAYPEPTDANQAHDLWLYALKDSARPFYELGFLKSGLSLNSRHSDPLRLTRMRVSPRWSGHDLLTQLHAEKSMPFYAGHGGNAERAAWLPVFGEAQATTNQLVLQAPPNGITGVWLGGSDRVADPFVAEVTFVLHGGTLRIPFLAAANESQRWDITIKTDGSIELEQLYNGRRRLIASDYRARATTPSDTLRLVVRHRQARILLNGSPLFHGWLDIGGETPAGLLGIRIAGDETIAGKTAVLAAHIAPQAPALAFWEWPPEWDAYSLAWTGRHAADITAISPPLDRFNDKIAQGQAPTANQRAFRTASHIQRWDLFPHLTLQESGDLEHWTPERLATRLADIDCDGLLIRFGEQTRWSSTDIAEWARQTAAVLQAQGRRLLLRIPEMASDSLSIGVLGRIPGVQQVFGATSTAGTQQRNTVREIAVPAPTNPENDLRFFFDLVADGAHITPEDNHARIREWRDQAEERFATGDYEAAVALWFEWHEADLQHPLPLRRIGDALYRLGYRDEAADFYRQSLEMDPGNIALAIELTNLLDASGHAEAARELLQVYGMLFPDDTAVSLAQAEWLFRRGRRAESYTRIGHVLEKSPGNLPATLLLAQLAATPEERRAAVDLLIRLGQAPETRVQILSMVRDTNLMTVPEADPLITLLTLPIPKENLRLAEIVAELTPRSSAVEETATNGVLSSAWIVEGGTAHAEPGRARIRAASEREEVLLRLSGTERWRDVFVEVDLADQTGEFWLIARRSRDHLVRFGFDSTGDQLALQIWSRERGDFTLLHYYIDTWARPSSGGIRLRLEIRGHGVVGYVDGRPWGKTALALPAGISVAGSVAIAARSIDPGHASMALRRVASGPIYPVIGLPRAIQTENEIDVQAANLRQLMPYLNTISPTGFSIDSHGQWTGAANLNDAFFRLFARFHAIRLLPRVRVADTASLRLSDILQASAIHNVKGFILETETPPDPALIEQWNRDLTGTEIDLFFSTESNGATTLIGCGQARFLLPGGTPGLPAQRLPFERFDTLRGSGPAFIAL